MVTTVKLVLTPVREVAVESGRRILENWSAPNVCEVRIFHGGYSATIRDVDLDKGFFTEQVEYVKRVHRVFPTDRPGLLVIRRTVLC